MYVVEYISDKSMIYSYYVQGFMFYLLCIYPKYTSEVHVELIGIWSSDNLY